MVKYNYAVEILGIESGIQNTSFGFYVSGPDRRFKWSTSELEGFKDGILLDNWLSNISKSIDVRRSGNYASVGGCTVSLKNTGDLYGFIQNNEIDINGKLVHIRKYSDEVFSSLFFGVVSGLQYNGSSLDIEVDEITKYRNTVIGKQIGADQYIPVNFGELDKAKYVELVNRQNLLIADDGQEVIGQCWSSESSDKHEGTNIQLAIDDSLKINGEPIYDYLFPDVDLYVKAYLGEGSDIIRRANINPTSTVVDGKRILTLWLYESLLVDENGVVPFAGVNDDPTPLDTEITYFQFYDVEFTSVTDDWHLSGGFKGKDIYTVKEGNYIVIPDIANSVVINDNAISLVSDSVESFGTIKGYLLCDNDGVKRIYNLSKLLSDTPEEIHQSKAPNDNLFDYNSERITGSGLPDDYRIFDFDNAGNSKKPFTVEGEYENIFNTDHSSKLTFNHGYEYSGVASSTFYNTLLLFPIRFIAPGFNVNSYKILIDVDYYFDSSLTTIPTVYKYAQNAVGYFNIFKNGVYFPLYEPTDKSDDKLVYRFNNVPNLTNFTEGTTLDDDTSDSLLSDNKNFWRNDITSQPDIFKIEDVGGTGFNHYFFTGAEEQGGDSVADVNISDLPVSRDIVDCLVGLKSRVITTGTGVVDVVQKVFVRHIGLYAEVETDFTEGVYSAWIGRRNSELGDLLETPSDIYDHILRLQNYSINGEPQPAEGWGYGFIGAYFGYVQSIDEVSGKWASQLLDRSELETGNIKRDLLRNMWGVGFIDNNGKENMIDMRRVFDPLEDRVLIEYDDIVRDSISNFSCQNKSDIFVLPALKYKYSVGTQTYEKEIAIIKVDAETYDASYVIAPDGVDKEMLWDKARSLYEYYGVINQSPGELMQSKWIQTDADAENYISTWLDWQGAASTGLPVSERRFINFDLPFEFVDNNELDIGSLVTVRIPYLSSDDLYGMIVNISTTLQNGNEKSKIGCILSFTVGEDLIIETGSAEDEIHESGDREDEIQEQGGG